MSKLFPKCNKCQTSHFVAFLKRAHYVCSKCGHLLRLDALTRINLICDRKSFEAFDENLKSENPLDFPDYSERLKQSMSKTQLKEAIVTGKAKIKGFPTTIGVMDTNFMMASMGSVVGEKITRMLETAADSQLPAILFCASGGARMQEGILSLMQMVKTSAAVRRLNEEGFPFISILTDPTTGGVSASFAMLGNIIIAEPNALIGFAGPRVIEQTIGQKLPPGFQESEFLKSHGMVDMIVERKQLRNVLGNLLKIHAVRAYKAA